MRPLSLLLLCASLQGSERTASDLQVLAGLESLAGEASYTVDRRFLIVSSAAADDPELALAFGLAGIDDLGRLHESIVRLGERARADSTDGDALVRRTRNRYRVTCVGNEVHQAEIRDGDAPLILVDTPELLIDYQGSNRQIGLHESGRLATLTIPFLVRPIGLYVSELREYEQWSWREEPSSSADLSLRLEAPAGADSAPPATLRLLVDEGSGLPELAAAYDASGSLVLAGAFEFALVNSRNVLSASTIVHGDADSTTIATADLEDFDFGAPGEPLALPMLTPVPGTLLVDFRVVPSATLGRSPALWPPEIRRRHAPAILESEPTVMEPADHGDARGPSGALVWMIVGALGVVLLGVGRRARPRAARSASPAGAR